MVVQLNCKEGQGYGKAGAAGQSGENHAFPVGDLPQADGRVVRSFRGRAGAPAGDDALGGRGAGRGRYAPGDDAEAGQAQEVNGRCQASRSNGSKYTGIKAAAELAQIGLVDR